MDLPYSNVQIASRKRDQLAPGLGCKAIELASE
jgi:hypothetical protein